MILDRILGVKREEISKNKQERPVRELLEQISLCPAPRDFKGAIAKPGRVNLIAEFKRASPSKGIIRADLAPQKVIRDYGENGAAAISVLTEEAFFQGKPQFLEIARQTVDIPLLRKDFMIDEYQIYESRVLGADAILLIVAALSPEQLNRYLSLAHDLGMSCLVEVHSLEELTRGLQSGAEIIGINNRNLHTFATSLQTTLDIVNHIPANKIIVSESGINTLEDVKLLGQRGVHAVLVGEALMRSPSPGEKARELAGARL